VIAVAREEIQAFNQIAGPESRDPAVRGVGHYSHDAIFRQRATGPSALRLAFPPGVGAVVKDMIRIQQGNQDVDIEQSAHAHRN
jgi:hypothetical protein